MPCSAPQPRSSRPSTISRSRRPLVAHAVPGVLRPALFAVLVAGAGLALADAALAQVQITAQPDRVTVHIDGQPFTDFHTGGAHLNRVNLHPLRAATGTVVNRSVPAGQVAGETVDHPHHAGVFYGHGDVNGVNFWAIRNEAPPQNPSTADAALGRIVLAKPVVVSSGPVQGTIDAVLDWLRPDGRALLTETRRMTFHSHPTLRIVDVDIDLEARERVEFRDTKEGTFALRVATALDESPRKTDEGSTARPGRLLNAQGAVGEKNVWGKRSEWVDYAGWIGNEPVGIVLMDHPSNPRHPTYWHSRGYGLHSINPFGVHDFLNDPAQNGGLVIPPGEHVRFRYRLVIHPGLPAERIASLYAAYARTSSQRDATPNR